MLLYRKVRMITDKYIEDHIPLGAIGYVIDIYDDRFCEVEFSETDGTTYALQAISVEDFVVVDNDE